MDRPIDMEQQIERVLIRQEQIARRVRELAGQISRVYQRHDPSAELVVVPILNGVIFFLADLVRHLPFQMRLAVMTVNNYRGTTQPVGVQILQDLAEDIRGKDVLVLDDILDTGQTLAAVVRQLSARQPRSLRTCVLLRKRICGGRQIDADFVGFDIDDVFVIGYGLDYQNLYRHYPHLAVLKGVR